MESIQKEAGKEIQKEAGRRTSRHASYAATAAVRNSANALTNLLCPSVWSGGRNRASVFSVT